MKQPPFLSIIICTYNRAGYLFDTLQSLLRTNASSGQFEILIIDNNSTDHTPSVTPKIADRYPDFRLKYIKEAKQGLSYARNCGIKEAAAPILLFLDDDITLHPGFIPAWIQFFKSHPNASGGGGKIHVQFDDPRPSWMSHFLLPLLGHHDLGNKMKRYPSNKYPFGGNMAFQKEIFDQYGAFNTNLGRKGSKLMAGEEKEFYGRLAGSEQIYYLPDAFLWHRVNKQRLTKDFIKKQALGLGKSIAFQMQEISMPVKIWRLSAEIGKLMITILLCIGYSFRLQFPKARMLLKFRRWIWEGYRQ
jgi:glycosyltransferase involved in cell wall biosynthesis